MTTQTETETIENLLIEYLEGKITLEQLIEEIIKKHGLTIEEIEVKETIIEIEIVSDTKRV